MKLNSDKIKIEMARNLFTNKDLAEKAELSLPTVQAVISGKSCSTITAGKLARALDSSVVELLDK